MSATACEITYNPAFVSKRNRMTKELDCESYEGYKTGSKVWLDGQRRLVIRRFREGNNGTKFVDLITRMGHLKCVEITRISKKKRK